MKLTLLCGKSNRQNLNRAISLIAARSEDLSSNHIVIVPEKFSLAIEKKILFSLKRKACHNIQVVTFSRLTQKLHENSLKENISKQTGVMVIRKVIIENLENFVCFKKAVQAVGFAESIYDTILQLKSSNILVKDMEALVQKAEGEALKLKLKDIALLYKKYEEFISGRYTDGLDSLNILEQNIAGHPTIKNSMCYVIGFDSFTSQGYAIVKKIIQSATETLVTTINLQKQNNSYISTNEVYENVKLIAASLKVKAQEINVVAKTPPLSSHIQANLYAYPFKTHKVSDEVILYEALSVREEVERVAMQIKKEVMGGKRFRDMAVVVSDMETYAPVIKTVFKEYGIAVFIDKSDNIASHPFGTFILDALAVAKNNYRAEDVILLSKNIFLGLSKDLINSFENYIVKFDINYDAFLSPFIFGKDSPSASLKAEYETAEQVRQYISECISPFVCNIKKAFTVSQYTAAVLSLITQMNLPEKLVSISRMQTGVDENHSALVSEQVGEKIRQLLLDLVNILGETKLTRESYISILSSGINACTVSLIPEFVDSVTVGEVSRMILDETPCVFIMGATEGALPFTKDDCGVITDHEIGKLQEVYEKKIEPTIRTVNKRERLKLFDLLLAVTEKLFVSYPVFNAGHEQLKASHIINELKKIFVGQNGKNPEVLNENDLNLLSLAGDEKHAATNFALETGSRIVGEKKLVKMLSDVKNNIANGDILYSSLYEALKDGMSDGLKTAVKNTNEKKVVGSVKNARELFFKEGKTSASALETYFACPYKYFVEKGLLVREREEAKMKAMDVGNMLHKLAELFTKKLNEDELLINNETKAQAETDRLINEIIVAEKYNATVNRYLIEILKKEAQRLCKALVFAKKHSCFKTQYTEVNFGDNGVMPGLLLEKSKVKLSGFIDRIDICDNKFRVIDYKTGKIKILSGDIYYGKKLQLFSYLSAAKNYTKLLPAGVFYFPIKNNFQDEKEGDMLSSYRMMGYIENDPGIIRKMDTSVNFENKKSKIIPVTYKADSGENKLVIVTDKNKSIISAEDFALLGAYTERLADEAVNEIIAGNITPSPYIQGGEKPCDYCCLKFMCAFNEKLGDKPRKFKGEKGLGINQITRVMKND